MYPSVYMCICMHAPQLFDHWCFGGIDNIMGSGAGALAGAWTCHVSWCRSQAMGTDGDWDRGPL